MIAAVFLAACGSSGTPISGDSRNLGGLTVTFRIEPAKLKVGQRARFTLAVQNNSGREEKLDFATGQRYDFRVERGGREVWRWSADRAFAQVLGTETIEGQSAKRFSESWSAEGPGTYTAFAKLTTASFGKELSGEVEVE